MSALCPDCQQDMGLADGCNVQIVLLNGKSYVRLRYGYDDWTDGIPADKRCHDCNCLAGCYHHLGCDMERCPKCQGQLISCGCWSDDEAVAVKTITVDLEKPAPGSPSPAKPTPGALNIADMMQRAGWWRHRLEQGDYAESDGVMYAEQAVNDVYALVAALQAANARIDGMIAIFEIMAGVFEMESDPASAINKVADILQKAMDAAAGAAVTAPPSNDTYKGPDGSILTLGDPRWDDFVARLEGPDGCDFKPDENGKVTWRCHGGQDRRFARAILEQMDGVDVDGTLAYCSEHGGHCDCEIIFNVDNR